MPLWFQNLAAYSVQIGVVALIGTALQAAFRLKLPKVSLAYWQGLLLACVVLPLIESWQPVALTTDQDLGSVAITMGPGATAPRHFQIPVFELLAMLLVAGVLARLIWMAIGLWRLNLHRKRACAMSSIPAAVDELRKRLGIAPEFMISSGIRGPVTLGALRPVVLLPTSFLKMEASSQRAIACHELLHVRRRDWLFNLAEELILAALWFHPAIWWLVRQIRLAREQAVDREVVGLIDDRKPYLKALLEIASGPETRYAVLAPEFMDERQFAQRIALLLKEVSMSRTRVIISLTAVAALLLATAHIAVSAFPLRTLRTEIGGSASSDAVVKSESQDAADSGEAKDEPKGSKTVPHLQVIHKVAPAYPPSAKLSHIEGKVTLQVTVEKDGEVSDVAVISGNSLLADAAVAAVRQWRFAPPKDYAVLTDVTVNFTLAKEKSDSEKLAEAKAQLEKAQSENNARMSQEQQEALARLEAQIQQAKSQNNSQSTEEQQRALAQLNTLHSELRVKTNEAEQAQTLDQHIAEMKAQKAELEAKIAAAEALLQQAQNKSQTSVTTKPIKTVPPVYPPEAKRKHIQGTVILRVTIDEDGAVTNVQPQSGPEILVKAATEAVKKWEFAKPTLAPVVTSIEVHFTLADPKPSPSSTAKPHP